MTNKNILELDSPSIKLDYIGNRLIIFILLYYKGMDLLETI